MTNAKPKPVRFMERGNTVVIALIVLVLVAVGAIAYLSGNIGPKSGDMASETAATEPAAAEQATQTAAAQEQAPAQQAEARPLPEIRPGNPVVAQLNNEEITRLDVFNFIQTLNPQTQQLPIDQLFPLALDQVVTAEIITKKVEGVNLDNDPAVKEQLAAAKNQIVRGVFMQQQVEKELTDERLRAAYDQYAANFPEIPEVKTRHILVEDEKLAKDLLKQLKEGGDFAALAAEHSIDPTKENGGELGYMSRQDQVIPEYLEAAFSQKVGEVSKKPIKTDFGYHIVEVLEERMRPPATFDQAKPFLSSQLRNVVLNEVVNKWREEADVNVFDINGDPIEPAAGDETPAEAAPADNAQ